MQLCRRKTTYSRWLGRRRVEIEVRRLARAAGLDGDPCMVPRIPLGTWRQTMLQLALYTDLPHDIRRDHPDEAREAIRRAVLTSSPEMWGGA